ncbi:MAG TPA: D-alanine--D-alanine ligase family protein [Candidatus Dormibacteraeota bacterium]|nr:D-alanine--D-alanine ligase family protein [Candidatus Dormibacteraeota bacterium]
MSSLRIGVFFGGRSVEHEVSVLTAQQVMSALDATEHGAVPVYIAKSGRWYTGDALRDVEQFRDVDRLIGSLSEVRMDPSPDSAGVLHTAARPGLFGGRRDDARIDMAMPLVHGSHGEDGTLQGLFELCDLPYTGCGVAASAVSMDKPLAKEVLRSAGLPVLEHALVHRAAWRSSRQQLVTAINERVRFPAFVKPATLGSSIGVSSVDGDAALVDAVELALTYDSRCLVEPAMDGAADVNCSVLGRGAEARASVCERPVSSGLLSYADKYLSKGHAQKSGRTGMKGAQREIPAPIGEATTHRIQDAALSAFRAIGCEGVVRVDFLVSGERFVVNEVNTIPGSLSFYLWEPSGVPFPELLETLVALGLRRHEEKRATTFSIDTWLLRGRPD